MVEDKEAEVWSCCCCWDGKDGGGGDEAEEESTTLWAESKPDTGARTPEVGARVF